MKISLLSNLMLSEFGLISNTDRRVIPENSRVFLKQGDLDGACGIYALMMALIASGALSRADALRIWNKAPDGRTLLGKFTRSLDGLTQNGLDEEDLIELFIAVAAGELQGKISSRISAYKLDKLDVSGKPLKGKIDAALDADLPLILKLDWEGGGRHWVVVIGSQSFDNAQTEHYLILDPSAESDTVCAWNGALTYESQKKGPRPYRYWGRGISPINCAITGGVVFSKHD